MKNWHSETSFSRIRWESVRAVLLYAWLMLLCAGPMAAELRGLYRAEMAVPSSDESARAEAFRRGLDQVLRRVVRTEDLSSAAVRSALAKPETCVLQFEYTGAYRDGKPILRVDFDPARIRQVLHQQGVEVWGSERPDVLAWIALEDNQPLRLIGTDSMPDLDRLLRELADDAGLAITLPLGDLSDEQSLNAVDVATGNAERIRGASARYETAAILAGRLARNPGGGFEGDWRLYRGNREERWQTRSVDLRAALSSALGGVYARLAGQLVPHKAGTATLELRIIGIASLDDSNRVAAYLGKLSPVTKVEWLTVGTGDASFRLSVRGGREMLEETLAAGKLLRPAPGGQDSSRLTYQLMP